MDIVELVRTRYTTKHYDPARRISDRDIADLMEVLRLSPSSVNSQPWHFFVTGTDEGKARVMPAVLDFNRPRVADASHLVVFAVPVEFTEERFRRLVAQELADGRVTTEDAASGAADAGRRHFVGLHQVTQEELLSWETRQAYIAMGFLLWAAAERGIDSTCLEGLDLPRGPRHGEDGRMPRTRRKGPAHRLCREPRLPPARRQQRRPSEVPPAHGRGRDRLLTHGSPLGAPAPDPTRSGLSARTFSRKMRAEPSWAGMRAQGLSARLHLVDCHHFRTAAGPALQGLSDSISNQDFTRASPDEQAVHFSSFRSDGVRRAGACRRFGRRQVRA